MGKTSFIGIDLGTSGVRAIAIDGDGTELAESTTPLPAPKGSGAMSEQAPELWWQGVMKVLDQISELIDSNGVKAISVDGTSGTVLLADAQARPLTPGLMYNDARATEEAAHIATLAPRESAAHGASSGLAKLLWLLERAQTPNLRVHTQADWIARQLGVTEHICDANNALKLGYDPVAQSWPEWMGQLQLADGLLPQVVKAGTAIGNLSPTLAERWRLPKETQIVSGTTDSTAAFIASGAIQLGEAVTALGSTLVLKVIADKPIFAPEYGIYSHPLGDHWLVGGASNSGGRVLRQFFSNEQLTELSQQIEPNQASGLDYLPLLAVGERFPVNDPTLEPRLSPRPESDALFLHGLLEGIARIEKAGYDKLAELGAPYPTSVRTNGGGAHNSAWQTIRQKMLGVEMKAPRHNEAAYGAALLARNGATTV